MYTYFDIVEKFSCEMCGKCCQNAWLVTIDEASYNRNKLWFDRQGSSEEFKQAFTIIEADASPGEYASINKGQNGCWFLENDKRCRLHKAAGHQHLDAVCQTFPRYPMATARGTDITLSLACPAVFRLIEREEPLRLIKADHSPTEVPEDSYVEQVFPKQKATYDPLRNYFEIEYHIIDLLQCRAIALPKRLQMVAETVARISGMAGSDSIGSMLNRLFEENYALLEQSAGGSADHGVTTDVLIEHFLVNLTFRKVFYSYGLERGSQLLTEFYRQILLAAGAKPEDITRTDKVKAAIKELEFEFGHNRKAMKQV